MLNNILLSLLSAPIVHTLAIDASTKAYPVVDLQYAKYRGIYNATSGINSWYGIRYAAPPTGDLRWAPPAAIETNNHYSKSNPINATVVGPECIQGYPAFEGDLPVSLTGASEDCLLLDVKVPANPKNAKLPVMLEIHGGGYTLGAAETVSPGDSIVYQSDGNVIYVSIQYRLGGYGFLGGADVAQHGTLNAGLLDQRLAIQWVNKHIEQFGGDASKITIMGSSAGGGSVMNQMILYGGETNPGFQAVIAEYPWWQPYKNAYIQQETYDDLLTSTGCSDITCLRALDITVLAPAIESLYETVYHQDLYGYGDFLFGPVVDGNIVQNLPSLEFQQGHFSQVPLLVNHEGYEGVIFSNTSETTHAEEVADVHTLWPEAKESFFTRLFELYPRSAFNSTFFQRQSLFGDAFVACPTYFMASMVSDYGMPVYKMRFNAGSELHGSTIPFLYSTSINAAGNNFTLAQIMRDYFISFAVHQNPSQMSYSGVDATKWQKYTPDNFRVLDVNYTEIAMVPDYDVGPRCDFLSGQSYALRS